MAEFESRYAVYFVPREGCAHDRFGTHWLGRDARSGQMLPQSAVFGLSPARLAELTASARRYGLHATLKPPFHLRNPHHVARLDERLRALASGLTPFSFRVEVAQLDGFLAWRATERDERLSAIAALCVMELDDLRRPSSEAEIERRRAAGLNPRQEALLQRWGYPYVHEEFRFHITLTDRLAGDEAELVRNALETACQPLLDTPLEFDALALFEEDGEGQDLRHIRSYGFDGSIWSPKGHA